MSSRSSAGALIGDTTTENNNLHNQVKFWFVRRGESEVPGENLSVQSREPTNSTHSWPRIWESNPGHIGGRECSHHCAIPAPHAWNTFHNVISTHPLTIKLVRLARLWLGRNCKTSSPDCYTVNLKPLSKASPWQRWATFSFFPHHLVGLNQFLTKVNKKPV